MQTWAASLRCGALMRICLTPRLRTTMRTTAFCHPTRHQDASASTSESASQLSTRLLSAAMTCLTLSALSLPAAAATLNLVTEPPPGTNQGDTETCIIAATTCPQNLINFMLYGNNANSFSGYSPDYIYTPGLLGGFNFGFTRFDVAIDSGTSSSQSDTLNTFLVQTNSGSGWVTRDSYLNGPAGNIGNPQNNGNGFSDYLLQTVDLTSLASGTGVRFFADLTLLTGGPESFFVKVVESQVPAPGSLALLGLGMLGLGVMLRPRRSELGAGLGT